MAIVVACLIGLMAVMAGAGIAHCYHHAHKGTKMFAGTPAMWMLPCIAVLGVMGACVTASDLKEGPSIDNPAYTEWMEGVVVDISATGPYGRVLLDTGVVYSLRGGDLPPREGDRVRLICKDEQCVSPGAASDWSVRKYHVRSAHWWALALGTIMVLVVYVAIVRRPYQQLKRNRLIDHN